MGSSQQDSNQVDSGKPSMSDLLQELKEHNVFFDGIVDMIPSKLYVSGQSGDDYNPNKAKYYHHSRRTHDDQEAGDSDGNNLDDDDEDQEENEDPHEQYLRMSPSERKAAHKAAKKRRLNPQETETTLQVKQRVEGTVTPSQALPRLPTALPIPPTQTLTSRHTATTSQTAKESAEADQQSQKSNKKKQKKEKPKRQDKEQHSDEQQTTTSQTQVRDHKSKSGDLPTQGGPDGTATSPPLSRIEILRAKLHAKIAEKAGQRPTDASTISKRAARRMEKRRRQEEAAQRNRNGKGSSASPADSHTMTGDRAIQQQQSNNGRKANEQLSSGKHNVGADTSLDLMGVDFGRLTGLNSEEKKREHYMKANKALANMSKTKNLEKMLANAQAKRDMLQQLKHSASEQDQVKATAMQWADTLAEADGQRVKDDPVKLKKALQRKAAKKAKSAKAWKSRLDQTQSAQQERQEIRQHNLQARKQGGAAGANLSKKKIVSTGTVTGTPSPSFAGKEPPSGGSGGKGKRRLSRAGFEGKKQGFLNSPREPKTK